MASSLSNLVCNLAEGKNRHSDKKCKTFGIKSKECDSYLEYTNVKDDLIVCKCLSCNRDYQKKFDENLRKKFADTIKFSNRAVNKFILLM